MHDNFLEQLSGRKGNLEMFVFITFIHVFFRCVYGHFFQRLHATEALAGNNASSKGSNLRERPFALMPNDQMCLPQKCGGEFV
jgi:hypothetical protein